MLNIVLPIDALYECVCEWVNGNKLYCKAFSVVSKTRKVLYKYRSLTILPNYKNKHDEH